MTGWISDLASRIGGRGWGWNSHFNPQASPGSKATNYMKPPTKQSKKIVVKNRPLNMTLFLNLYAKLHSEKAAVLFHRETKLLCR
jgi:hypothetical protein